MDNSILFTLIALVLGLLIGAGLVMAMLNNRHRQAMDELRQSRDSALQDYKTADLSRQEAERSLAALQSQMESTKLSLEEWRNRAEQYRTDITQMTAELGKTRTEIDHLNQRLVEERASLQELNKKFATEFENVANRLLEDKSKKFTEMNSERLGEIIRPFREKLQEFENKVDSTHLEESKSREAMLERLRSLEDLNRTLGEEAEILARALRGDNKVQGDWGEVVLERILQSSGLIKGMHYTMQESFTGEEGRSRPDAIIRLPDNKHLIVDSKVSLKAYTDYVAATDPAEQESLRKAHCESVRMHMNGLSKKSYENIEGLTTPAFVIMFVPNDAAYLLAMNHDKSLYEQGYQKRVVVVGPSNLMGLMMTIDHLWKQETQQKNMDEIIRLGESMLDKFCGFVDALDEIGQRLSQADKAYEKARTRLSGNGSVIRLAQRMQKLGIKTRKALPNDTLSLLDANGDSTDTNASSFVEPSPEPEIESTES